MDDLQRELVRLEATLAQADAPRTAVIDELSAMRRGLARGSDGSAFRLPNVRVGSPCKQRWDDMVGDDRVRHCNQCGKNVYQLSAMTRAEAEALVQDRMDDMPCVHFYRRSDGTMLTQDCPVGVSRRRRRRLVIAGIVTAAAVLVVNEIGNSSNCSLASDPLQGEIHQGIGAVSDPGSQAVYK